MKIALFSERKLSELCSHPKENLAFNGSDAPSIHFNPFAAPGASHGSLGIFIITFISSTPSPACILSSDAFGPVTASLPSASSLTHPTSGIFRGASSLLLPYESAINILPRARSLARQLPAQAFQHFIYNKRCLNCLV